MPGKKEPIDGKMHCSKCNDWKLFTIDNFYMKADGKFMLTCKSCLILSAKQYESDKKNGVLSRSPRGGSKPVRSSNGEKRCSLCKCWKPLDYFRMTKDKRQNKVYPNNRCIDCDVQYHRQHKSPKTQETYKREYQKIKADPIKKLRNHVSKMILKA